MTLVRKNDISFEPVRGGVGAGGQHRDKNSTGVRATHNPSGLVCVIRGRSLKESKRQATEEIRKRLNLELKKVKDKSRKFRWRKAIAERNIIRTYNCSRGVVKDHRTGATASIKDVLGKGNLDALKTLHLMGAMNAEKIS